MTFQIWPLVYSVIFGLPIIAAALLLGRSRIAPKLKVWSCRLALLKLWFGLLPLGLSIAGTSRLGTSQHTAVDSGFATYLSVLWATGLCVVLLDLFRGHRAARNLVQNSSLGSDESIEMLSRLIGLRKPQVRLSIEPGLPFATGIVRPTIILPPDSCEASVLAHELVHIKNRDILWSLVARLTLGVFWFCPFIHKLEAELALWQEAVADQEACELVKCPLRVHASSIVLSVASSSANLAFGARLSGDGKLVARRLKALYTNPASKVAGWAAVLGVAVAVIPVRVSAPIYPSAERQRAKFVGYEGVAAPVASPIYELAAGS